MEFNGEFNGDLMVGLMVVFSWDFFVRKSHGSGDLVFWIFQQAMVVSCDLVAKWWLNGRYIAGWW